MLGTRTRDRGSRFDNIYFFHGRGGSPNGSVKKLAGILSPGYPEVTFHGPTLPHSDITVPAEKSLDWACGYMPEIKPNSLIVGISWGGLIAAKLQEIYPDFVSVMALVSPTKADSVVLTQRVSNRVAIYSTADNISKFSFENWPDLTDNAFDVPFLVHDVDLSKYGLSFLISCYMQNLNMRREIENLYPERFRDLEYQRIGG